MADADTPTQISADDVRDLCGDVLDWKVRAILALQPTAGDIAAAVAWAGGQDDLVGHEGRSLMGAAAQVYDLLMADEFPEGDQAST